MGELYMITVPQLQEFKEMLRCKIPGYIIPEVEFNTQGNGIMVFLVFPDSSKVSTLIRITENLSLDDKEAVRVLSEILGRSIQNLKSHLQRLEQLQYLITEN